MRCELSGRSVLQGQIHIPAWGAWWADLEADGTDDGVLVGAAEIALNDIALSGTVLSSGFWSGRERYRVVGGAGGWGRTIPRRSYTSDAGVKRATILQDAAKAAGEQIDLSTVSGAWGPHYARAEGPAGRVLHQLAPQGWYVDLGGVTRIGSWLETTYTGDAVRTDRADLSAGRLELAPYALAELLPGAQVDTLRAVDVVHRIEAQPDGPRLRTEIWGSKGQSSRLPSALLQLVEALTAHLRYLGTYSYRVVAQVGERLDLQPERAATGLPDLVRVRVRLAPGLRVDWTPGSLCLVAFVDGDPGRPVVVAGDDPDSSGWLPGEVTLNADGAAKIAGSLWPVLLNGQTVTLTGVQPGTGVTGAQIFIGPVPPVPPPLGPARLFSGDLI